MSVTQEQVVDYIKNLKLSQVKDLIKVLEDELGVEASAPMFMGAMAAPAAAAAEVEEQTAFDVVMSSFGAEKIKVIKKVREITGLGLKEAKDLVENVPAKIKEGVTKDEAKGFIEALVAEGATVEMK